MQFTVSELVFRADVIKNVRDDLSKAHDGSLHEFRDLVLDTFQDVVL